MSRYIWPMSSACLSLILIALFFDIYATPMAFASTSTSKRPIRSLHFVLAPSDANARALDYKDAQRIIEDARKSNFNTIIMQIANSINFDSTPVFIRSGAWSKEQLLNLVKLAKANNIELIPEIKLLTHQEKFFGNSRPDLMFNSVTYDPRKSEIYDLVFPYLDEIIKLMRPAAIHIGHDELIGWNKKHFEKMTRPGESILSADLFLEDVKRIHSFLKKKGISTWIWGDVLLAPDEFPGMDTKYLHGTVSGYGKALRDQLPKDIVICDWHYVDEQPDFPSLAAMKKEGFRVLGATWKKEKTISNFSRYAAQHGADGMIATTWFHVPRKEWSVVEGIIHDSGEIFKKDFPDAR